MAERRILVTGATGFVGGALVRRLSADRRADARAPIVRAALRTAPSPTAWPGDDVDVVVTGALDDRPQLDAALQGVHCVIHTAGLAHLPPAQAAGAAARFHAINCGATLALARAAAAAGVRRFVFVSSIKVNGEFTRPGQPFTAGDARVQVGATDAYGHSKAAAESGLEVIAASTGLEVVIVRPPLVYGPGAQANFGALVRAVARGMPLPLGAIGNARSLVALDSLVDFLLTCAAHPAATGRVLLVSDGEDVSTAELARRIGVAMDRPARLVPVPVGLLRLAGAVTGRQAVVRRLLDSLQVDSAPSRLLLQWTPPVTLDEGLRRAVAPLRSSHADAHG